MRLASFRKCCGFRLSPRDYHEVINHPDVDAVAICSSTNTHASMMIEAARAGKHIFCEKPIAYDLAKIDEALDVVEKAGVLLQIGLTAGLTQISNTCVRWLQQGKLANRISSALPVEIRPLRRSNISRSRAAFFST